MKYRFWQFLDTLGHKHKWAHRKWICDKFDQMALKEK